MPTPYIKEIAKEKGQPVSQTEKAWEKAKQIVQREKGKPGNKWAEITDVFKHIEKVK